METMISLIIPTCNAEKDLPALLKTLHRQSRVPDEIIVIDSSSNDRTEEICKEDKAISFYQIDRKDFDHGRTRDEALRKTKGDIVVFMTQDAIPANENMVEKLIKPLVEHDDIAVSTGRQLPKSNATIMEQYVRIYNYPSESHIRSKDDLPRMGIKTFFCSDVCAAYNRNIYLKLGGFDYPIKTNEDMFFAAKAINNGYRIAYVADALVYHSHNLTLREQYKRNYIQGYEIERHKKELSNVTQASEGMKLVKYVSKELLRRGRVGSFVHFGFDCCARLLGSRAGKKAYIGGVK